MFTRKVTRPEDLLLSADEMRAHRESRVYKEYLRASAPILIRDGNNLNFLNDKGHDVLSVEGLIDTLSWLHCANPSELFVGGQNSADALDRVFAPHRRELLEDSVYRELSRRGEIPSID